jgi:putative transposase
MIEQTVQQLTPIDGTRPHAGRWARRRRRSPAADSPDRRPSRPRPVPARALSEEEREAVLAELHGERFVDCSSARVWATLLDQGRYLAWQRMM